jgi:hypothetical protein
MLQEMIEEQRQLAKQSPVWEELAALMGSEMKCVVSAG